MGKKMKLPFSFISSSNSKSHSSPWPWSWPSCSLEPRKLSLTTPDDVYKTMNSTYIDMSIETPESWFTNSSESPIFSTDQPEDQISGADPVEKVIRGLRSDRLFFKPGETSSILEEAKNVDHSSETMALKESSTMFLTMDSQDPQVDFRNSMEEMVEAHGLKNWKCLEELLFWFLRVNEKSNHNYIFGAYIDLLVGLSIDSSFISCPNFHSTSSPLSIYTSSSSSLSTTNVSSSFHVEDEEEDISLSSSLESEKKITEVTHNAS